MVLPSSADKMIFDAVKQTQPAALVIVCAWCPNGRELTDAARKAGAVVSHGMCRACIARFEQES